MWIFHNAYARADPWTFGLLPVFAPQHNPTLNIFHEGMCNSEFQSQVLIVCHLCCKW